MTEAEICALLIGHEALSQYQGTPFDEPSHRACRKLKGQLDPSWHLLSNLEHRMSFRPLAPEIANLRAFQAVFQALSQRRELRFRYKNLAASTAKARRVRPYHLTCIDNHWYLFAYDLVRQAMRTFALTRMSIVQISSRRFTPPRQFDPDKYLGGSFAVLKGADDYEVVIEFDAWATDLVRGRRWHASQTFAEFSGAGSQLRMRLSSLDEIERWVLNWGTHATVLKPQALARRLQTTALELVRKYRN